MNRIAFPLERDQSSPSVADLQTGLRFLIDKGFYGFSEQDLQFFVPTLESESADSTYGDITEKLVSLLQERRGLQAHGRVDEKTAEALNELLEQLGLLDGSAAPLAHIVSGTARRVHGAVRDAEGQALQGISLHAFDRDLRSEQALGTTLTNRQGFYEIQYFTHQFRNREKGNADLVIKAFSATGESFGASSVLFNASPEAELDLTIPAGVLPPPSLIEKIDRALTPLLGELQVAELEQDAQRYCQLNLKEAELKQVSPQFANSACFLAADASCHFSPILQAN